MTTGRVNREGDKPCVALIGLRGCGKSTIGRELADILGGECVDTDNLVVERAGQSIAAIFENEGEAGFRRREREAVERATQIAPAVISVGGGALLDERNLKALREVSVLVWLTAPADVLWQRISSDQATIQSRPALTNRAGPEEMELLLAKRSRLYERAADLIIETTGGGPREVAEAIVARLNCSGPASG